MSPVRDIVTGSQLVHLDATHLSRKSIFTPFDPFLRVINISEAWNLSSTEASLWTRARRSLVLTRNALLTPLWRKSWHIAVMRHVSFSKLPSLSLINLFFMRQPTVCMTSAPCKLLWYALFCEGSKE